MLYYENTSSEIQTKAKVGGTRDPFAWSEHAIWLTCEGYVSTNKEASEDWIS